MRADVLTSENWRTWPHLQNGVMEVRRLVPWRQVPPAAIPVSLPVSPISFARLEIPGPTRPLSWEEFLEQTHADGLAVLFEGALVSEFRSPRLGSDQPHLIFSIAKSLVGLVAEMLIAEGRLDVVSTVARYVPELKTSAFGDAQVGELMDMIDGVAFDENYADFNAQIHQYSRSYWGDAPDGHGVLAALRSLPVGVRRPGGFAYRTPVADALSWVVRRAAAQRLSELISERIWQPIGAEHPAYVLLDRAGDEIGGTGFGATLADMSRLARVLMEGGRLDGRAIFPEAIIRKISKGGLTLPAESAQLATRIGWSYKSQWWATGDKWGSFAALGVFGQRLFVSPGRRFAIVRFGSFPRAANTETDALHAAAFEAVYDHLTKESGGE